MKKEAKYIVKAIALSIWHDITSGYSTLTKPKEVLNILFFIFIGMIYLGQYQRAWLAAGFYFIAYVWKIINDGSWRKDIRNDYGKKN